MSLSVRTRFEVFKRDDFRCRYCGQQSPAVVLEVDHVVPRAEGGTDDPINLVTSCWDCNRGKADVPLNRVLTGEDPHDRAVEILERERQLREYNEALAAERARIDDDAFDLIAYWNMLRGGDPAGRFVAPPREYCWLQVTLKWCPREVIRDFMDKACAYGFTRNLSWVNACVRNWRAANGLPEEGK